jgi:hypothetical protein
MDHGHIRLILAASLLAVFILMWLSMVSTPNKSNESSDGTHYQNFTPNVRPAVSLVVEDTRFKV